MITKDNKIFEFIAGSHSYGLNTPQSDRDIRGVYMLQLKNMFTLFNSSFMGYGTTPYEILKKIDHVIQIEDYDKLPGMLNTILIDDNSDLKFSNETISVHTEEEDSEYHELRRFMKLAAANNPNIIEFLYANETVTHTTDIWEFIRDNRHLFLSKRVIYTYTGYAHSQWNRIVNHRTWLRSPKENKPQRKDYGLPEQSIFNKSQVHAVLSIPNELLAEQTRDIATRERQYRDDLNDYRSYQEWKKNRNEKRAALEADIGYDAKHASHLMRLYLQAKDILTTGTIRLKMPEHTEMLLKIKQAKMPFEELLPLVESTKQEIDNLSKKCTLQESSDTKQIGNLYYKIAKDFYKLDL